MKRIGLLTGGGDCPGLNAAIRAVVRRAPAHDLNVLGFRHGWQGLAERDYTELTIDAVAGILPRGGTILATSRTNPYTNTDLKKSLFESVDALGLHGVVVIGGDGTLRAAARLVTEDLPLVGIPKTIDNDVAATDLSIGYDTAVSIACEALDRLHSTAESHDRVMVVEVMGHRAGWIAVASGIAAGADIIVVPEFPTRVSEVCGLIEQRRQRGRSFSIVVVAEGAALLDEQGQDLAQPNAGMGSVVARAIEERTGHETRVTVLGHVQRGGTPTAADRVLATRMGVLACDLVAQGHTGMLTALRGRAVEAVRLDDTATQLKPVDAELFQLSRVFFG